MGQLALERVPLCVYGFLPMLCDTVRASRRPATTGAGRAVLSRPSARCVECCTCTTCCADRQIWGRVRRCRGTKSVPCPHSCTVTVNESAQKSKVIDFSPTTSQNPETTHPFSHPMSQRASMQRPPSQRALDDAARLKAKSLRHGLNPGPGTCAHTDGPFLASCLPPRASHQRSTHPLAQMTLDGRAPTRKSSPGRRRSSPSRSAKRTARCARWATPALTIHTTT